MRSLKQTCSFYLITILFCFIAMAFRSNNVYADWPFEANGPIHSSPAVADLDSDGEPEIIVGSFSSYWDLYCINKRGQLLWKFITYYDIMSSPAIADLNGDKNKEILVGSLDNYLYCIDKNGQLIWAYETKNDVHSSPLVVDLEDDGIPEILFGSNDYNLYCLDKDGQIIWKYRTGYTISSSPAAADLNNDGNLEILIGSDDSYLYCINKDGELVWKYSVCSSDPLFPESFPSSPVVADIDNDGNFEILIASSYAYHLYCIDKEGRLVWKYEIGYSSSTSPAAADLNNDGNLEILIGSDDGYLYCVNKNGELVWKYLCGGSIQSSPAIADINKDGNLEILIGSADKGLHCIDKNGQLIWLCMTDNTVSSSPAITDLDGDGNLEVLVGSWDGKLYCLNKDGETFIPSPVQGPIDPMPWPMFRHDLQRTGWYEFPPNQAPIIDQVPNQVVDEGGETRIVINASDPDDEPIHFLLGPNMPAFAQTTGYDDHAEIIFKPTFDDAGVYENITVSVEDQAGLMASTSFRLTVNNVNRAPMIDKVPNLFMYEGEEKRIIINAYDLDNEPIHFLLGPNIPEFGTATGYDNYAKIVFRPGYHHAGTYENITVSIEDEGLLIDSTSFTLTVLDKNGPPIIKPIGNKIANRRQWLRFYVCATDPDGDKVSYDIVNKPRGACFNKKTGMFAWKPDSEQAGDFEVTFIARDNYGNQSSETIIVTVPNSAPVLDSIGDKRVERGQCLIFFIHAFDSDGDRIRYNIQNQPRGALFFRHFGLFIWRPRVDQVGDFAITFIAEDTTEAQDSETITITVPNTPPSLNPIGNKMIDAGKKLKFKLTATDTDRIDSRILRYYADGLPRGASLNHTIGLFSWRPTKLQIGAHQIRFYVKDGAGTIDEETITVVVH